jgi:hypothetical protein
MATKQKKSTADKFSELFDQDWGQTKSRLRDRAENRRTYDITNSWDAKSDNPKSFSRLDQTLVPFQKTCPIVLSGAAVVELEDTTGFNAINVKHPEHERTGIPLTINQQDVGMKKDLSASIPMVEKVKRDGKTLVMEKSTRFENMQVQPPVFREVEVPEVMKQAGEQVDQKLLNPQQRRQIYETSSKIKCAEDVVREAQVERMKTRKQMAGPQFHRGVLMVDSSDNIHSEIYGEKAREAAAESEYKRQIHLERRSKLAYKTAALDVYGNVLIPDTIGPRVKLEKPYQSKGGNYHALSFEETQNRLFCQIQGPSASKRTQMLRDIELSGKDYNITQHTIIEHWPPRNYERQIERVMVHPSQNTLEGQRNVQGSFRFG